VSEQSTVWFLTGSQDLYGEETLRQVAQQSKEVVQQLSAGSTSSVSIVWKPVLKTSEDIAQAMVAASMDPHCLGVITWMHTFSPAKMWVTGLGRLLKPLLHLHTQAGQSLPWNTIDMDFMNLNQSAHGDREFAHLLSKMNISRKIVVGHPTDGEVILRVDNWLAACRGWNRSQNLRIARFGDNMRYVAVTDGDKVSAQAAFGMSIESMGVNLLAERVDTVSDAEAEALCQTYEDLYSLADDLLKVGDKRDSLVYGAKVEIALRNLLTEGGFHGFTTNFEDLGALLQLPGLAVQRLMAEGYGFGGEGDWKTAALLAIVKSMDEGQGSSFMEDYTYHFGPGKPKVLGAHMLEVCPTVTTETPRIEVHPLGIGEREDPVRMVFTADSGPARVLCLVDMGDRFRIIVNEVDLVAPEHPLVALPVAHAVWEPQPSLAVSAEAWMLAGGSHHTVLTRGVSEETFADFARIAGVELVSIGPDTNRRSVEKELQWSAAYHRLSASL
jgi:L-arabinose isomerase